nr:SRPBCC family protein [uncultured Roseococcus sp.]
MPRTGQSSRKDQASRLVRAAPARIYQAFVDPQAWIAWLPPKGMTARLEHFEPRAGGTYRMILTYDAPGDGAPGKSSAMADVVQGRFVELLPNRRLVQEIQFESEDPAFAGAMTMTWSLAPVPIGTQVTITCTNVPDGIRPEDHAAGLASSLENLEAWLGRQ